MLMFEKIISVIAPHTCIGCGVENNVLVCEACQESIPQVPSRCYHCKAATTDFAVCSQCRTVTSLRTVMVYTKHKDIAKELLHRMKYERAQSGIAEMARMMAPLLAAFDEDVLLAHVPTATKRVRLRGYDHAKLLSHSLGRISGHEAQTVLARLGQAHQVGSSRAQRLKQIDGAFRPVRSELIKGRHIVLVDDVLTTGATLEVAARTLRRAGAKRVSAIVFAEA